MQILCHLQCCEKVFPLLISSIIAYLSL
uniref:Uncharacterized protein n=1 Tax=Anguilla anguilla TaxID=7936 RepID=A0A0E9T4T6_ANGAN